MLTAPVCLSCFASEQCARHIYQITAHFVAIRGRAPFPRVPRPSIRFPPRPFHISLSPSLRTRLKAQDESTYKSSMLVSYRGSTAMLLARILLNNSRYSKHRNHRLRSTDTTKQSMLLWMWLCRVPLRCLLFPISAMIPSEHCRTLISDITIREMGKIADLDK